MVQKLEEYKSAIRGQVIELARENEIDASGIKDDDTIPEKGYLDSASIIQLILWYEEHFKVVLEDDEVTIDSFGSINAMAQFAIEKLAD